MWSPLDFSDDKRQIPTADSYYEEGNFRLEEQETSSIILGAVYIWKLFSAIATAKARLPVASICIWGHSSIVTESHQAAALPAFPSLLKRSPSLWGMLGKVWGPEKLIFSSAYSYFDRW